MVAKSSFGCLKISGSYSGGGDGPKIETVCGRVQPHVRCSASRTTFESRVTTSNWLAGVPPQYKGIGEAYAPRRKVLDKILADAAVESGAELREGQRAGPSDAGRCAGDESYFAGEIYHCVAPLDAFSNAVSIR